MNQSIDLTFCRSVLEHIEVVKMFSLHIFSRTRDERYTSLQIAMDLAIDHFELLERYPSYLSFCAPMFCAAGLYERFIRRFKRLHFLRGWILYGMVKCSAGHGDATQD